MCLNIWKCTYFFSSPYQGSTFAQSAAFSLFFFSEEAVLVTFFSDCRPSKLRFFNNYADLNSEVGIELMTKIVFGHQVHRCRISYLIESLKRCPTTVSDLTIHIKTLLNLESFFFFFLERLQLLELQMSTSIQLNPL